MRGFACAHAEKRHRLDRTCSSLSKQKDCIGSYYAKDAKYRPFSALLPEGSGGKMPYVKLVLVLLMCGSFMGLLHSPSIQLADDEHRTTQSSSEAPKPSWMSHPDAPNAGYASSLKIDWSHVEAALKQVAVGAEGGGGGTRVALLNFEEEEVGEWRARLPHTEASPVRLDHVGGDVTWDRLYPEWIDEEELYGKPSCPDLPAPAVAEEERYDVVAVKLPCGRAASWSKDVARLHLQLAAARLAARGAAPAAHVLVVSRCFPAPNLLRCRDEVARVGDVWLYRPDADDLRRKLALPVGSCELAMPFAALGAPPLPAAPAAPPRREAYATILHSEQLYACGAVTAAQSIRMTSGSGRDMVALVDETIGARHRAALEAAGWRVRAIRRIRNPRASAHAYNEWNYSKFWLWALTEYDRVIFLDADLLVQRPMEALFDMPEVSAAGNSGSYFNSGVMVVEPCDRTFRLLAGHVGDIESYNGGDQGYLNEVFSWWHRLPSHANYMKHFWEGDTEERRAAKRRALAADPPVALAVHFVGLKPWFCFRDYDCNWNVPELHQFASDEAHARWWRVHDAMPPRLREMCLLDERQKALLRWDIARAREANLSDGHWAVRIADPRRSICAAGDAEACREREIAGRRVEGNRITTSYAKLIGNF